MHEWIHSGEKPFKFDEAFSCGMKMFIPVWNHSGVACVIRYLLRKVISIITRVCSGGKPLNYAIFSKRFSRTAWPYLFRWKGFKSDKCKYSIHSKIFPTYFHERNFSNVNLTDKHSLSIPYLEYGIWFWVMCVWQWWRNSELMSS